METRDNKFEFPKDHEALIHLIQGLLIDMPVGYDIKISLWIEAWLYKNVDKNYDAVR